MRESETHPAARIGHATRLVLRSRAAAMQSTKQRESMSYSLLR